MLAEWGCALYLRAKGYRLLARRFRTTAGEIDLIALRKRTVVFVEVKARPTQAGAAESLSLRQRDRVRCAAYVFLARNPQWNGYDYRFDVVLMVPWRWPCHIVQAW